MPYISLKSNNYPNRVIGHHDWLGEFSQIQFEPSTSYPYYPTKSNYRDSSMRFTWRWEDLGGIAIDAPAVASSNLKNLEVFARGTENHLWHMSWDGSRWSDWEDLGGTICSAPAAVSHWGNIDCVVRGMDNHIYHKSWDGSRWSDWEDLGGTAIDAPAVASWGVHRLDVFARGTDNNLLHGY
jgi:hypothetical protein